MQQIACKDAINSAKIQLIIAINNKKFNSSLLFCVKSNLLQNHKKRNPFVIYMGAYINQHKFQEPNTCFCKQVLALLHMVYEKGKKHCKINEMTSICRFIPQLSIYCLTNISPPSSCEIIWAPNSDSNSNEIFHQRDQEMFN